MIDLHAHTTASDGSLSPRQLVEFAKKSGITTLGITDHDTVDGIDEARRTGKEQELDIVPGLEFSAEYEPGTMHILAYESTRLTVRYWTNWPNGGTIATNAIQK